MTTSTDLPLEDLIDLVVTEAEIESGLDPSVVSSRTSFGRRGAFVISRRAAEGEGAGISFKQALWSPAEKSFVRKNLGKLSLEEIGAALGRSENGVKILFTRNGWPAPSKQPDELTAHQIAELMGKCGKSIARLIDDGILPGRRLPMERVIRVVKRTTFKRWLIDSANWIYFDWQKINDPKIKRLCELKAERWEDQWITTGEAARITGCAHGDINRWIHMGKIESARKWGRNWKMLRSEAQILDIPRRGKGSRGCSRMRWSRDADAFMVLSRAVGISTSVTSHMMGSSWDKRVAYRLKVLHRRGLIPALIDQYPYPVEYDGGGNMPSLFTDWRFYLDRYPFLESSVSRFLRRDRLGLKDIENVRGILYRWANWHIPKVPYRKKLCGSLQSIGRWDSAEPRLRTAYKHLLDLGIDPLSGCSSK